MRFPNGARAHIASLARRAGPQKLVSVADAAAAWSMNSESASRRLGRLVRAGWVHRVSRGFYEVRPLDASAHERLAVEDPWILAQRLWHPCYIGGWTAAGHRGLTEQLFRSTFVVTSNKIRASNRSIGDSAFRLAYRKWDGHRGVERVWRANGPVSVATRERTIIDGCVHPAWLGGGRMLAAVVREAVQSDSFSSERLLGELSGGISGGGAGRLGVLLERMAPHAHGLLAALRARIKTGYVRFDPSIKRKGKLITRWGVWLNISLDSDAE